MSTGSVTTVIKFGYKLIFDLHFGLSKGAISVTSRNGRILCLRRILVTACLTRFDMQSLQYMASGFKYNLKLKKK